MRNYEAILVINAGLTDEEAAEVIKKFNEIIKKQGGEVKLESPWGRRRLPYIVEKKTHGIFHMFFFEGNGEVIEEMNLQTGYDDNMIKMFVTKVGDLQKAYDDFEALKVDPLKNAKLITESVGV